MACRIDMDLAITRGLTALVVFGFLAHSRAVRGDDDLQAGQLARVDAEVYQALAAVNDGPIHVIVVLKPETFTAGNNRAAHHQRVADKQDRVLTRLSAQATFVPTYRYTNFAAFTGAANAQAIGELAADPEAYAIGLDAPISAMLGESVPFIGADQVHSLGYTGNYVTVAVLDTGIDTDHPDLADDIDARAWHFLDQGANQGPGAEDDEGHGTFVAGIITSAGNNVGVAPDARILPIKVLDSSGNGFTTDWIAGIDYVVSVAEAEPYLKIINMSLGSDDSYNQCPCDEADAGTILAQLALAHAQAMGIITFAATGNGGSCNSMSAPACLSAVVPVVAEYDANYGRQPADGTYESGCFDNTTAPHRIACFSDRSTCNTLAAPGTNITSSYLGGGIAVGAGTSAAAPHAAGVAALLWERYIDDGFFTSPGRIEFTLYAAGHVTTNPCGGTADIRGIDALAAVNLAPNFCLPGPPFYDYLIAPCSSWRTTDGTGFGAGDCRLYKMYLQSSGDYDFSLCNNDGVGGIWTGSGDGDLAMYNAANTLLWSIDGNSSCGYDASTLSTQYQGWSPSSDGWYYLKVSDGSGQAAAYSLAYRGQNGLDRPTSVNASDGTYCDRVRVTWNGVTRGVEYDVWRSTNGSACGGQLIASVSGTSLDDFSATTGTTYYYSVRATNDCERSACSSTNTGLRAGTPSPPSNVSASDGVYCDRVRITWNSSFGATFYNVYRDGTPMATDLTTLSYDDLTAAPGQNHEYRIQAVSDCAASVLSTGDVGYPCSCNVTITTPLQGTTLQAGTTSIVTWDSPGISGDVSIYLGKGSDYYYEYLGSVRADAQAFYWDICEYIGNGSDFFITVSWLECSYWRITTSGQFTIADSFDPPTITLTSPLGGETIQAGDPMTITWTASAQDEYVDISLNKGGTFLGWIDYAPASQGSITWSGCDNLAPGNDYSIEVRFWTCMGWITDESQLFTVTAGSQQLPSLTLTSPLGGETFQAGDPMTFTWDTTATDDYVFVDLYKAGAFVKDLATAPVGAGSATSAGCSYLMEDDDYTVKLSYWTCAGVITDESLPITIAGGQPPPTLMVTSPIGGETFQADGPLTITWDTTAQSEYVDISLRTGGQFASYVGYVPASQNLFNWGGCEYLPDNGNYSIHLWLSTCAGVVTDESAQFTILGGGEPLPSLALTSPLGGEIFQVGQPLSISWDTSAVTENVNILLWRGNEWGTGIGNVPAALGTFTWDGCVTLEERSDYSIELSITSCAGAVSSQGGAFSISGGPQVPSLTSPKDGDTLQAGQPFLITWESTGAAGDITIGLLKAGSWVDLVGDVPASQGSMLWEICPYIENGTDYSIQLWYDNCFGTVVSESDTFTIVGGQPAPTLSLISPSGGESLLAGDPITVTWDTTAVSGEVEILMDVGWWAVLGTAPATQGVFVWESCEHLQDRSDYVIVLSLAACDTWVQDQSGAFSIYGGGSDVVLDCNQNRVPDECDVAFLTSVDCNSNSIPDECETILGSDYNMDGSVGIEDYAGFADCFVGVQNAVEPARPECVSVCLESFDADADQDVDLADAWVFQRNFGATVDGGVQAGAMFFTTYCAGCHGPEGSGGLGPNIRGLSAAQLQTGVENAGIHGGLSIMSEDYANLAAFLKMSCGNDSDCDDGNVCTSDECVDSHCSNSPIANCSAAESRLFVVNVAGGKVTSYAGPETASGDIAPDTNLEGHQTQLSRPRDIVVNSASQLLAVNVWTDTITKYEDAYHASGNILPSGNVLGAATELHDPSSMALNRTQDLLLVADVASEEILVFQGTRGNFDGNLAPVRIISSMDLNNPLGINFGLIDDLYVANTGNANVLVFANASALNGNVAATRVITSPAFVGANLFDVFVDQDDIMYVVDAHGFIYMFNDASTLNGMVNPDSSLEVVPAVAITAIAVDANNTGYIVDVVNNAVYSYDNIGTLNGAIDPDRTIQGGQTRLSGPIRVFLGRGPSTVSADAGPDRSFVTSFPVGQIVEPGLLGTVVCTGSDTEFDSSELESEWIVVDTPPPATAANVNIINVIDEELAVQLLPVTSAQTLRLRQNGTTSTVGNIAIPGEYTFQCQVTNPNGDTATDNVTLTIVPYFTILTKYEDDDNNDAHNDDLDELYGTNNSIDTSNVAAAGVPGPVLNGLALDHGELTNYVTSSATIDVAFAGLFRQSGSLRFAAFNLDTGDISMLNTVAVTANGLTTQDATCVVSGLSVGTYAITASFSGPADSGTADAVTDVVVHVQPDLSSIVSIVGDVGPIDSTAGAPRVHGSSGGNDVWVSDFIVQTDTNLDGVDDIIVINGNAINVIFTTSDPTATGGNDLLDNTGEHIPDYSPNQAFPGNINAAYTVDLDSTLGPFAIFSVATGDLNGDGFPDLAIGQATADNTDAVAGGEEGRVIVVYHRGENFLAYDPAPGDDPWDEDDADIAVFNGPDVADAAGGFLIGYNVAIGNFLGNSIDDLVFTAPGMDDDANNSATGIERGRLYIFTGSPTIFGDTTLTAGGTEASTTFGRVVNGEFTGAGLALGSFNDDGDAYVDIAIGIPGFQAGVGNNGAILTFFGENSPGDPLVEDRTYEGEANDFLGRRVYAGEFDGNGQDDIVAAGAASATINGSVVVPGVLYILPNNPNSDVDNNLDAPVDFPKMTGFTGENLGWRVGVGDWDRDGRDDMLVSALGDGGTSNDEVFLVLGADPLPTTLEESTTFTDVAAEVPDNTNPFTGGGVAQTEESLLSTPGSALGIVDVNGDTYLDIFISEATNSAYLAGRNNLIIPGCITDEDCGEFERCDTVTGECIDVGVGACVEGAGNCFTPNFTPGCETAECCERVCSFDPNCCFISWL